MRFRHLLLAGLLFGWGFQACFVASGSPEGRAGDIEAAKRLIAEGSVDRAAEILERLVAADPKDADAHLLLGTALALIPRRSEAIQMLRRAVELRPDFAQVHLTLGMALARFGELDAARQAYEKAVALDPQLIMAHVNLAVILAAEGELAAAVDHFSQAIDREGETPEAARYLYLRGKVYRQQNVPEEAEKDFTKAVQLQPGYARAYLELGRTRADLQNATGALEALRKAVEFAPDDAEARYELGSQYLRAGQAPQAVEHLQVALDLQPDDRNVLYALARALRAAGRMDEAKPLMERLEQSARAQALHDPDVLKAGELNNEGVALEKDGRYSAALEKYRAALAISPQEIEFRKNLALVLCRLERWNEAVSELREVLKAAPGDPDATKALYIALEKTDDKP